MNVVHAAYLVVTVITIAANTGAAVADLGQARPVLANMAEVRVPRPWLRPLGLVKLAGAAGLVLGLLGAWPLGIAAAAGLVLFFTGALVTHVRARVFHNIAFPAHFSPWPLPPPPSPSPSIDARRPALDCPARSRQTRG
jgi:DoxX-like protein